MIATEQIRADLLGFVGKAYPGMTVRVELKGDKSPRLTVSFIEERFRQLYARQRHHYLAHLIPSTYVDENLSGSQWFELAPGEEPQDIVYADEDLIRSIEPDVIAVLQDVGFFGELDDLLCPIEAMRPRRHCNGDFRNARSALACCGVAESDFFDIFHVLMNRGGFCDCEILYNAADESRLRAGYWRARAEGRQPYNPHDRN